MKKWEERLIEKLSAKWNEKFLKCTGGSYVGRINVEKLLIRFLREYKLKALFRKGEKGERV